MRKQGTSESDEEQTRGEKGRKGNVVIRRGFVGSGLAALFSIGAYLGLRGVGAVIEDTVDAKADAAFATLTKPLESTADAVLTKSVNALQTARPFVERLLHIIQTLQKIGTNEIDTFLSALSKLPFINTTSLQDFANAVNMLLDTKETDLLTLLDILEKDITGLKQQIIEAEQKAPKEINKVVGDGVRRVDPLAP